MEQSEQFEQQEQSETTRAQAFDWVGKNHWIPANMGASWLVKDLVRQVQALQPGDEITLDYRGGVDNAPHWVLACAEDGAISVRSLNGALDSSRRTRRVWRPTGESHHRQQIAHELMGILMWRRRRSGVVLVG